MLNALCTEWNKDFEQLNVRYIEHLKTVVYAMQPTPLPSFTPRLLEDIRKFQINVSRYLEQDGKEQPHTVEYLVFTSDVNRVFQLGGDLEFFVDCIKNNDRQRLTDYAELSIDVLYANHVNLNSHATTITLVNGNALGAGLEAALSSDYIVSTPAAQFQFPEVIFNMFPGMGAYSFMSRRTDPNFVEQMILTGSMHDAEEMRQRGLVDFITEPDALMLGLERFIKRHQRAKGTHDAVLRMRNRINPITHKELMDIAMQWVDAAFALSAKNLRAMSRIVQKQQQHIARRAQIGQRALR